MKKIFGILLMCFMVLCSCSEKPFDLEASKQGILDLGWVLTSEKKTEEDIKAYEERCKNYMIFDGYDVEGVDLKIEYVLLYANSLETSVLDNYRGANFVFFEDEEAAKFFYDYEVNSRSEDSIWKFQWIDNMVVSTNSEKVTKIIGGSFK